MCRFYRSPALLIEFSSGKPFRFHAPHELPSEITPSHSCVVRLHILDIISPVFALLLLLFRQVPHVLEILCLNLLTRSPFCFLGCLVFFLV